MTRIIKRQSVFETNSSSAHAISLCDNTINSKDYNIPIENNVVIIYSTSDSADFGRGEEVYTDAYTKLLYLLSSLDHYRNWNDGTYRDTDESKNALERIKKVIMDFLAVDDVIITDGSVFPQIDHQSTGTADLVLKDPEAIKDFIFNNNSELIISNDNGGMEEPYDYWRASYKKPTQKFQIQIEWLPGTISSYNIECEPDKLSFNLIFKAIGYDLNKYVYDFEEQRIISWTKSDSLREDRSSRYGSYSDIDERGIIFVKNSDKTNYWGWSSDEIDDSLIHIIKYTINTEDFDGI